MKKLYNLHSQRFIFFSPPKGGPEGLSSGDEKVGETIAKIDSALQKADELLATDSDKTDRMVVEDSKRTLSELRNRIRTGSLTEEQNDQLEYALDKIKEVADGGVEKETNPGEMAEITKDKAKESVNEANSATDNFLAEIMKQLQESDDDYNESVYKELFGAKGSTGEGKGEPSA